MSLFITDALAAMFKAVPKVAVDTPADTPVFFLELSKDGVVEDVNTLKKNDKHDEIITEDLMEVPDQASFLPEVKTLPPRKRLDGVQSKKPIVETINIRESPKQIPPILTKDQVTIHPETDISTTPNRFEITNTTSKQRAIEKPPQAEMLVEPATTALVAPTVLLKREREGSWQPPSSPPQILPPKISTEFGTKKGLGRDPSFTSRRDNTPPEIQQSISARPPPIRIEKVVTDFISSPPQFQVGPIFSIQEGSTIDISTSGMYFDRLAPNTPDALRVELRPAPPSIPLAPKQIAAQITASVSNLSEDTLELRLDPPELGKLVVTLTHKGALMSAHIMADRPDVLEFLRRNADVLSRELESSGFEGATLEFSQRQDKSEHETSSEEAANLALAQPQPELAQPTRISLPMHQNGALDIRI